MSIRLTVIVNLNDAISSRQFEFGQEMARRDWARLDSSINSPTFETEFDGITEDNEMLAATEQDITQSAAAANIDDWDAVCVLGYDQNDMFYSAHLESRSESSVNFSA